ncbi:MAG: hypothetical protein WDM85_15435 [Caulobacteraceae bacterium]
METRVVTAHIPIDLAEKVDALAERLERPARVDREEGARRLD